MPTEQAACDVLEIRENLTLSPTDLIRARWVVRASHLVIDGHGACLVGPADGGGNEDLAQAGIGIHAVGCRNVVLRNLRVRGFRLALWLEDCDGWSIESCDFSDNFTDPDFGWGEQEPGGGLLLERVRWSVVRECRAQRVWDGIHLRECTDNLILRNDFSNCTNVCAKLWSSSRNSFVENDLSYGIRIDRAGGEVHARDSSSVLLESGSNHNFWYRNRAVGGGDGFFIRPLNGWLSVGNVFVENDASEGNNNCFESWSPDNVYVRNRANGGSYGFWLGGSDGTVLLGNEACGNGLPQGNHNAPEPVFGHGGIVIVGGTATGACIEGNRCLANNGGGVVARGDVRREPPSFRFRNWVVQENLLDGNRWGLHVDRGAGLFYSANQGSNADGDWIGEVAEVREGSAQEALAPIARLTAPARIDLGMTAELSAEGSRDPNGLPLSCVWFVGEEVFAGGVVRWTPQKAGAYDVSLRVDNGSRASIAWSRILVAHGLGSEIGTEMEAGRWRSTGSHAFRDDADAVEGRYSLAIRGLASDADGWAILEREFSAEGAEAVRFWMRYRNENVFSWKDWAMRLRLVCDGGSLLWTGRKELAEWFGMGSNRGGWFLCEARLDGSGLFELSAEGSPDLRRAKALEVAFCSHGDGPYTVWLDGLFLPRREG